MKIGDKVVSLNNKLKFITTNKIYTIISIEKNQIEPENEYGQLREYYWIIDDIGLQTGLPKREYNLKFIKNIKIIYFDEIFITLKKLRKQKLQKMKTKNENKN